jgi:hypothetical protein
MPRLLPRAVAAALERCHDTLPDDVHRAAFALGNLQGTLLALSCLSLALAHAALYAIVARSWTLAACLGVVHDALGVFRVVFHNAAHAGVRSRERAGSGSPRSGSFSTHERHPSWTLDDAARLEAGYRVVFCLARLTLLGRAVRSEARAMINTTDVFALWLGDGGVGAFTVAQHALGCAQLLVWLAVFFARSTQHASALVSALRPGDLGPSILSEPRPEKYWTLLSEGGRSRRDSDGASAAFVEALAVFATLAARALGGRFFALKRPRSVSESGAMLARALGIVAMIACIDAAGRRRRGGGEDSQPCKTRGTGTEGR